MKKDPTLKFTNIQHDFRREHELSCDEYTLCDMVFFLSRGEGSQVPGWCYKSKENLANEIGISKQGVLNMIERMVQKGFIIRNEQTKYLKTTEKWQQVYFTETDSQQSLPPVQKQTASEKTIPEQVNNVDHEQSTNLTEDSQQSLPHNNTNNSNDTNNNNDDVVGGGLRPAVFKKPFKLLTQAEFREQVHYYKPIYGEQMCKEFYDRWRQKTTAGIMRFQTQNFWDTGIRLEGWKKFEQEEIQKRTTNGNSINKQSTGIANYAAIVGTQPKQGTSEARTSAVEDRLRRNEVLRSQAKDTTGQNTDQ